MFDSRLRFLILAFLLALAAPGFAEDKCTVKAVLGGKSVTMKYCAVALYDDQHSVALLFSNSPFTAKEIETFQEDSIPLDTDAAGKERTMISFTFCPGAGKPVVNAAGVKSVGTSVNVADSLFLRRQWVFELPKEKDILKIEKLSGDLKVGGKLTGRITGGKTSDGLKYSWEADFDMTLPKKSAESGMACGM